MKTMFAMVSRSVALACVLVSMLGGAGVAATQADPVQQPSARDQLQRIHTPQSIDDNLARLTKALELTSEQQQQIRPLLQDHHDRIQALLDKNPAASRSELGPQIHAISDDTHAKIHALLSDHQKDLEKALLQPRPSRSPS
jgi:Spy/CpxP family protein refolding chaperone